MAPLIANLVIAYLAAGLVVQLVVQVAVSRRGGQQPSSKGFRPAPGQLRWGGILFGLFVLWPVELIRWPQIVDRLMTLSDAAPTPATPARAYTDEEYDAAERRSDRMVMLWFVVIAAAAGLAGSLSAVTGWDAGWCALVVMGSSVGGFLWWASRSAADLPPPRPRPVRPIWILKMMGFLLGLCIVGAILAGIVGSFA